MNKNLFTAEEIKMNARLRGLINEFLDDPKAEVPGKALDYISENAGEMKVLVPAELPNGNVIKLNDPDDSEGSFDMNIRLIEDEEHDQWIPAFTSEEAFDASDDDDNGEKVPLVLADLMEQVEDDDDLSGIVLDPWGHGFPIPKEVMGELLDDDSGQEGGINLVKGNIEEIECEAIVNSANNTLMPCDGGVNHAVHSKAGKGLEDECRSLHGCKTGEAKITDAYDLPCDYVIHTVGPIYSGKDKDESDLAMCYENSLYLAREHGLHQVAFPCISTGNFGFPKEDALDIAVQTVLDWFTDNDDYEMGVIFCCHNDLDYDMYQDYLNDELGEPE